MVHRGIIAHNHYLRIGGKEETLYRNGIPRVPGNFLDFLQAGVEGGTHLGLRPAEIGVNLLVGGTPGGGEGKKCYRRYADNGNETADPEPSVKGIPQIGKI
jgi:hypothetical protein